MTEFNNFLENSPNPENMDDKVDPNLNLDQKQPTSSFFGVKNKKNLLIAGVVLVVVLILVVYVYFQQSFSSQKAPEKTSSSANSTEVPTNPATITEDSLNQVNSNSGAEKEIDYATKYSLNSATFGDLGAINPALELAKTWKSDAKLAFYLPLDASNQNSSERTFKFYSDSLPDKMFEVSLNGSNQLVDKKEVPKEMTSNDGFIDPSKIKISSEVAYTIGNDYLKNNSTDSPQNQLEPISLVLSYKKDSGMHVWTFDAKVIKSGNFSPKKIFIDAKTGKPSETPFVTQPILPGTTPETNNSNNNINGSANNNTNSVLKTIENPVPPSPPININDNFSFGVLGDTKVFDPNNSKGNYQKAVATISKEKINFMFVMGDLLSSCDGTSKCQTKLTQWKNVLGPLASKTYEVVGNHDRTGGSAADATWQKVFSLPTNGPSGFSELTYSFSYDNSHFVVLDSEKPSEHLVDSVQRAWLEKDLLENTDKENTFVFFHEPAYGTSQNTKDGLDANPKERDALWNILKKYNVTAVFNGHEHIHTRKKVGSIYQIVEGDTDSTDDDTAGSGLSDYSYKGKSYLIVNVNGKKINLKLYTIDGKLLNSFDLVR